MEPLASPQESETLSARSLFAAAQSLSDDALLAGARSLVGRERCLTAELIAHLAEIEARSLAQREGYSCMFVYCRDALGLSEHEAYGRIEAARAARKFPLVLELLRQGSLTLTSVGLLARHLTADNHRALLESARGKRKAAVEQIVARLHPVADAPVVIRKPPTAHLRSAAPAMAPAPATPPVPSACLRQNVTAPPSVLAALSPDRYKYQLTIDGETRELLALAKDLLRHVDPRGDDAAILKRALELLVAELARSKFAARAGGGHPSTPDDGTNDPLPTQGSRHVPAHVKRHVFVRDRGRCAFVAGDGHRCGERGAVEFHHLKPYAVGGEARSENIELRCRSHNQYEARVYFARPAETLGPPMAAAP